MENEWIEWAGGECPVDNEAMIEIRYNDGDVFTDRADRLDWLHSDPNSDPNSDIVAYRVLA